MTTAAPTRAGRVLDAVSERRRRHVRELRLGEIHVLRYVPGTSPLHRMWAGTKLVTLALLSIALLLWPSWKSIGIMGALLLAAFLAARLPRGISPRLPWWLGAVLAIGAVLALVAGGPPFIHIGSVKIGIGGLSNFTRFTLVGIDVLAGSRAAWLDDASGRPVAGARTAARPVSPRPATRGRAGGGDRALHSVPAAAPRGGSRAPCGSARPAPGRRPFVQGTGGRGGRDGLRCPGERDPAGAGDGRGDRSQRRRSDRGSRDAPVRPGRRVRPRSLSGGWRRGLAMARASMTWS